MPKPTFGPVPIAAMVATADLGFFVRSLVATKLAPMSFSPVEWLGIPFVQIHNAGFMAGFFVGQAPLPGDCHRQRGWLVGAL